ncbi:MAG: DUF4282 domain-containing protein [Beijerinckiaceae bacterium]
MLQDFLKFDQYLTPTIIRIFYLFLVVLIVLSGIGNLLFDLAMMATSFLGGLFSVIGTLVAMATAIIAARILTETIMVLFQNNEHLAAIRARAEGH